MIDPLIGELDQLPEKERKASHQTQHEYLALWTHVLAGVRPELDTSEAKRRFTAPRPGTV
ncbi:hypothetical protein ABZS68_18860 [Streptomyces sp. NPDC005571]|uniref:hypothetical protein n=1 Tax=unclassified Streptomyces TaxID=2593676 RepID=UPI0033B02E22